MTCEAKVCSVSLSVQLAVLNKLAVLAQFEVLYQPAVFTSFVSTHSVDVRRLDFVVVIRNGKSQCLGVHFLFREEIDSVRPRPDRINVDPTSSEYQALASERHHRVRTCGFSDKCLQWEFRE